MRIEDRRLALGSGVPVLRDRPPQGTEYVLVMSCAAQKGMVHRICSLMTELNCNVIDFSQFTDTETLRLFVRVVFSVEDDVVTRNELRAAFDLLDQSSAMHWQLFDAMRKTRVLLMVSKIGHCLNDLLFRYATGILPVKICGVISNHTDLSHLVASYNLPFHHCPLSPGASSAEKAEQERVMLKLVATHNIDLLVLARYMQILSAGTCDALRGKIINIHHSFLPSFKGSKPYGQAHERGVKLIGATAHFVTSELDEGPIIEQDVERIDHSMSPEALAAVGRDAECVVLARAVKWFAERRILVNGKKTVVFR